MKNLVSDSDSTLEADFLKESLNDHEEFLGLEDLYHALNEIRAQRRVLADFKKAIDILHFGKVE